MFGQQCDQSCIPTDNLTILDQLNKSETRQQVRESRLPWLTIQRRIDIEKHSVVSHS